MPENNWRQQRSPSPKAVPSMLPPLSKFYHGPVQGWNSTESSPSHNGSTNSLNLNNEFSPPLPPRMSPGPPLYSTPQLSQGWDSPAPSAPSANQLYLSTSYAPRTGANDAPIDPTWNSGPPDISYKQPFAPNSAAKPPLPPRSYRVRDSHSAQTPVAPRSRVSANTIDVPLFLQPVTYDPVAAPAIPSHQPFSSRVSYTHSDSPLEPERLPPPPPQKTPLDEGDDTKVPKMIPKRPQYDPQNSYSEGQQQLLLKSKRPQYDPQNSHDDSHKSPHWSQQAQQPTIPVPQFTSFNVESALSSTQSEQETSASPPLDESQLSFSRQNHNADEGHAVQHYHQSNLLPLAPIRSNLWAPESMQWEPRPSYMDPPDREAGLPQHQVAHSMSNIDLSMIPASQPSPDMQQTSNTSYKETEDEAEQNTHDRQGDDSFYWHSGRSSSDPEEDHGRFDTGAVEPGEAIADPRSSTTNSTVVPWEHQNHPARSTSLSPLISAPYGSSALGFGGPSDWEYFGDYEAEEIDDEELYTRPRSRHDSSTIGGSVELPADYALSNIEQQRDELGAVAPISFSTLDPASDDIAAATSLHADYSSQSMTRDEGSTGEGDYASTTNTKLQQKPSVPHRLSGRPTGLLDVSPNQRPDMDEIIKAWSEAPHIGQANVKLPLDQDKQLQEKNSPNPSGVPVASSAPEKFLGADKLIKDALSRSSLPSSINRTTCLQDQPLIDSKSSPLPLNIASVAYDYDRRQSLTVLSETPESALSIAQTNAEVLSGKGESYPIHQTDYDKNQTTESLSEKLAVSSPHSDANLGATQSVSAPSLISQSSTESGNMIVETKGISPSENPHATPNIDHESHYCEPNRDKDPDVHHTKSENTIQDDQHPSMQNSTAGASFESSVDESPPDMVRRDVIRHSSETPERNSCDDPQECWQIVGKESLQEPTDVIVCKSPKDVIQQATVENPKEGIDLSPHQSVAQNASHTCQIEGNNGDILTKVGASESNTTTESLSKSIDAIHPNHDPTKVPMSIKSPSTSFENSAREHKVLDPYADLDAWGKASLNRFAAMLREESRAETNNDKLNIFNVFTSRESRLRVVLYGTDEELLISPKQQQQGLSKDPGAVKQMESIKKSDEKQMPGQSGFVKQAVQRANTMNLQRSLKALPALPTNRESVAGLPGDTLAPLVIEHGSNITSENETPRAGSPLGGAEYSPGGRPIISYPGPPGRGSSRSPHLSIGNKHDMESTSQDISLVSEAVAGADSFPKSKSDAPKDTESRNSAYRPPKYNASRSEVNNYLANRKSIVRPFSTLAQGSLESSYSVNIASNAERVPTAKNAINAPTSQYNLSAKVKESDTGDETIKSKALAADPQPDLRRFIKADFDPLLTILPDSEAILHESSRLTDLHLVMDNIPDDFSFIHQSVVTWDAKAKKQRDENERQRHVRQIESEQKIDSLFDDHEIGYGDISELESEFKRSEAARKADEDRLEYKTFVSDVFNLVWTRLHYELDQLIPHYEQLANLMNHTLAGKEMFNRTSDGLAIAPTMNSFLSLHQKLEIRHQKAFEAVMERDRRLKKTEISPWYTLSNIAKVKQLEKQFQDAEKAAIIEYCEQRKARASRLRDVLNENTDRGVGANQDYTEAIMKAIKRIASGRAFASVAGSNEPTAGIEEVEKAKAITAQLATSSEQIVQTTHVADMLFNSADCEVSVARTKMAKNLGSLAELRDERAKEDHELMRGLEEQLAQIREHTRKANDEVVKLMLFLGITNGRADSASPAHAGIPDPGHKARIQVALEEAKKRNAFQESGT